MGYVIKIIAVALLGAIVATATNSGGTVLGKISTIVLAATGSVIAWIATNYLGAPILAIEAKRREAIQVAEARTWTAPPLSQIDEQRVLDARAAIRNVAADLRVYARTPSHLVRLYCQWRGYDLEQASYALRGLAQMAGSELHSDDTRRNNLDYLYIYLNAYTHLTPERVAEVRKIVADAE